MVGLRTPDLSVVIAAHAPDPARFRRVLVALAAAVTAACPRTVEVVVVRNCGPAIDGDVLATGPALTLIDEDRPGIAWARAAGISASGGAYIVFVDDDTLLDRDYLGEAFNYASAAPQVGVFGGRIAGEFSKPPVRAVRPALPFLALRDLGGGEKRVLAGDEPTFDVPGAGMVLRRDVALAFRDMVQTGQLAGIGRTGANLSSGDDTVCCMIARRMGLSLAYVPQLHLTHVIPDARLDPAYLRRLVRNIGASAARIDALFHGPEGLRVLSRPQIAVRTVAHVLRNGVTGGMITSGWHVGYREQALQEMTLPPEGTRS